MAQQRHRRLLPSVIALGGLFAALGVLGGCFDSDEVFQAADTTTGVVDPSTSSSTTAMESSSSEESSTGEPPITCRDAIGCIRNCAFSIAIDPNPEPDLSCFLDCEEGLTVREAYHLLRLANCAADDCQTRDACDDGLGTTGTGTGSGSTTGGGDDGGPPPLIDPCLECIFTLMQDENSSVCAEFHAICD